MARLPNRFDLWVRKAKECEDPFRQADYIMGSLAALKEWHFLNLGTKEKPQVAKTQIDAELYLLVYSDVERIEDFLRDQGGPLAGGPLPVISIPTEAAMAWCAECRAGLLVNPPEDSAMIPFDHVALFHNEWKNHGARPSTGYWIPNMTSAEEDFWQEHGL